MSQFIENQKWRYATKKFDATKKVSASDLEILKEYTKNSEKEHDVLAIYEVIKNFENKFRRFGNVGF